MRHASKEGFRLPKMGMQVEVGCNTAAKGENATEWKTWTGKATTAADGKETVTDDKTGETFSYTWTKNSEDGTTIIEADGYGKAVGVEMTVADWMLLEELGKALGL